MGTNITSVEDASVDQLLNDEFYNSEKEREMIEDKKFIDESEREELLDYLFSLKNKIGECYVKMGAVLHKIQKNGIYLDWNYTSFTNFVEEEVNFSQRKAHYLTNIWENIRVELNADTNDINKIDWSKTKEIARVEDTNKREEILNQAIENKESEDDDDYTVDDIKQKVKKANSDGDVDVKKTKRMHFNLYPEQRKTVNNAIKQASEEADSEKRNHLLEMICMHYLSSSYGEQEFNFLVNRIEDIFECELVAVDPETGDIIYGDIDVDE
jgi:hypothetical protein